MVDTLTNFKFTEIKIVHFTEAETKIEPITCLEFNYGPNVRGSNGVYAAATSVQSVPVSRYGNAGYFNGHAFIEIPYFINGYVMFSLEDLICIKYFEKKYVNMMV